VRRCALCTRKGTRGEEFKMVAVAMGMRIFMMIASADVETIRVEHEKEAFFAHAHPSFAAFAPSERLFIEKQAMRPIHEATKKKCLRRETVGPLHSTAERGVGPKATRGRGKRAGGDEALDNG